MQTVSIRTDTLTYWNSVLSQKQGLEGKPFDQEIESFEVPLCDDYVALFKLVNGDEQSGPYLDVSLYDGDQEVQVIDPGFETLNGIYTFYDSYEKRELSLQILQD
jgi:hypothetical protein